MRLMTYTTLILTTLLSLTMSPLAAQSDRAAPPASTFGETVDVRVVNVEAVVTDKSGTPVAGLTPESFTLTVDGQEVPIDYFTEIRSGTAVDAGAGGAGPGGAPTLTPGERVSTSYLVFVDDFFSIRRDRDQVLRGLIDQLAFFRPQDRMAVVAYNGKGLEMLTSWSSSPTQLRQALSKAMERPAYGLTRVAERRSFEISRTPGVGVESSVFGLDAEERLYAQQLVREVEDATQAAAATLRGFAAPPGRKVMLLLSGGWPFSIAAYVANDFARPVLDSSVPPGPQMLRQLTETANLVGYTLYPVDVQGLAGVFGVDSGTPGNFTLTANQVVQADGSTQAATGGGVSVRERDLHDGLQFLARETGGKALLNASRMEAFTRAYEDTRSYYWLGFTSQRKGDEELHRIKLSLRDKDLRIRSRKGFQDLSRETEVSLAVESVLLFGGAPGRDNLVVELGEAQPAGRKYVRVPLTIAVPVEAMTFLPDGDGNGYSGEVQLRAAAVNEEGDRSDIPVVTIGIALPEEPRAGTYVPYKTELRLRRQAQRVVLSLYDPLGTGFLSRSLDLDYSSPRKR